LIAACSPDSEQPQTLQTRDVFAAIAAAGASPISNGSLERNEACARQTSTFAISGDWAEFLRRLESELPSAFQRTRGGESGVVTFGRLLPGDVESVELVPKPEEAGRFELRYSICAG
jgi:hypothetical protein